jgi:hypothetical protein
VGADVSWIHLAQDREQWQALVNMSMNLQVHNSECLDMTRLARSLAQEPCMFALYNIEKSWLTMGKTMTGPQGLLVSLATQELPQSILGAASMMNLAYRDLENPSTQL